VRDVGVIAHYLQCAQALRTYHLVVAVDEHLGGQVHLLAAFWTGIYHIVAGFIAKISKSGLHDKSLQKLCRFFP
jgi:hypothetical protein